MSNMSYCRFSNTLGDLRDCYDNMDEGGMSYAERMARWKLIRLCRRIADDYEYEGSDESMPAKEDAS